MGDQWMNDCLVTYIERDVFDTVDNDAIMQRFQNMKSRRGQFYDFWRTVVEFLNTLTRIPGAATASGGAGIFNGSDERYGLHDSGGRKFLIAGIGAVGCCPSQRNRVKNEECYEEENQMAIKYNEGLKPMLEGLKSELKGNMTYSYVDVYDVFASFIQTPSAFGFTEVKAACCGLGNLKAQVPCVPVSTYCSNRSDHIFWDLYHPTETAARILVDMVFDGSQQYAAPINVKQLIAA